MRESQKIFVPEKVQHMRDGLAVGQTEDCSYIYEEWRKRMAKTSKQAKNS